MRSRVFFITWRFAITLPKYSAVSRSKWVHNLSKWIVLWVGVFCRSLVILCGFPRLLGLLETRAHGQIVMISHIVSRTLQSKQEKCWQCLKTSLRQSLPWVMLSYVAGLHARERQSNTWKWVQHTFIKCSHPLLSDLLKGSRNESVFSIAVHFFGSAWSCSLKRGGGSKPGDDPAQRRCGGTQARTQFSSGCSSAICPACTYLRETRNRLPHLVAVTDEMWNELPWGINALKVATRICQSV